MVIDLEKGPHDSTPKPPSWPTQFATASEKVSLPIKPSEELLSFPELIGLISALAELPVSTISKQTHLTDTHELITIRIERPVGKEERVKMIEYLRETLWNLETTKERLLRELNRLKGCI